MNMKADINVLYQNWVHSHEEDTETEMVFRPATFKFPPSRGRKSFDLKPDGSLVETGIGPTDRPQENQGTWKLEDDDSLVFYFSSQSVPKKLMQIVSADKDRLVIKRSK
jgi:hypothetical protein